MKSFQQTLNYSSSNEDSRSEIRALQIGSKDSVLCITGSGARSLDLLIETPTRVVSIDFNPAQNFLLELKMAAMRELEYEEDIEFLGVCQSENRVGVYERIKSVLSPEARSFWNTQLVMLEDGIIYQGRWERYFRKLAQMMYLAHPHLRKKLLSCSEIGEQTRLWHEEWNNTFWRTSLRFISSRAVWKYLLGDPGFYRYVPVKFSIYEYLNKRFTHAFEDINLLESAFANLFFFGAYDANGALPAYLQKKYYKTLRNNLGSIQIVTQSLLGYLNQCGKNQFHCYSLSDFASYTDVGNYESIWKGIVKTASKGARICERQFLVKREIPADVEPYVQRNKPLEQELTTVDDSIFYTFIIAGIRDG